MRRYGSGAGGRIGTAAALRAIAVLLRRHPKAAIDMAGAGLWAAGRVGLSEMSHWLAPAGPGRAGRKPKAADRLSNRDRRRLRKLLERERDSAER